MPYQDGNFPSGAGTITIPTTNGVIYKCNSFNLDKSDSVTDIQDENGKHAGALSFGGKSTFSTEIQLANASLDGLITTAEANATTGTFTRNSVNYFITGISEPKPSQGAWVVNLSGQRKVN